jgi:glycosyltransferase involved in cell wall biosynthesis
MPLRYLIADLFVLPSRGKYETWGLAVNEAMHMGVPCLVSSSVGCQRDLVTQGETGWVFDPEKPGALFDALALALDDLRSPERALAIRQAAAKRILDYTYEKTAGGLMSAIAALPKP